MKALIMGILVFAWMHSLQIYGQQIPVFSGICINQYAYNPAYAGSKPYLEATIKERIQYLGIEYSPHTQYVSVHSSISNRNFGLGGSFYNETNGILGRFQGTATYSYYLQLSEDAKLSFGLSGSINQVRTIASRMILDNSNDLLLNTQSNQNKLFFTGHGGALLHGSNYSLGFSVLNLVSTNFDLYNGASLTQIPHFNLDYSYGVFLGETSFLNFTGRHIFTEGLPTWHQLALVYDYNEKVHIGAGYRWEDATYFMVGASLWDELRIYYSYDLGLNNLTSSQNGSHELTLNYHFHYDPIYSKDKKRYNTKYRGWRFSFKRKPKPIIATPDSSDENED